MKTKLMQCENGEKNTIIETEKLLTKKECKNITKTWTKKCPKCNNNICYKHQTGLIYSLKNNTVCKPCSYKRNNSFKNKFKKLCTDCNCIIPLNVL